MARNKLKVVITGGSAGVGRAVAEAFAQHGHDVALIARDPARLERAANELAGRYGVRALALPADVANAEAVDGAAEAALQAFGRLDVWVNVAMATAFAPVAALNARDIERGTQVTYLGQVNGMLAALRCMRAAGHSGRGTIVNVGSALSYRAVPLQSVYCGAKFAIRGFTDALRSELLHDGVDIHLTMVDLPAINTPQFDWAMNLTGRRARPVPPVFQPEVAARAIYFAATHRRRQVWVGWSTAKAILANRFAPGLLDRYLARAGYRGQITGEPLPPDAPSNLYTPVPGDYGAHGRFDDEARARSVEMFTDRHRSAAIAATICAFGCGVLWVWRRNRR